ncbi:MAG: YgiQ family radical SAM protein [Candidatus Margulisbacteria bacterium]|nr:YgiQ family radical SAM protein [Candidatus Margulisiibacteriota bacterium]
MHFLPTTLDEARALGWDTLDIILVSGDAYIDHPSFGPALIGRYLEARGFKVGIIPQPNWRDPSSVTALGKPNLFFCVSAGNIDSLVNNYTADKKPRRTDMYSPNNEAGHRPDRASIVYTAMLKRLYKNTPVALGGVEASLRRFVHYDYWDDKPRRSLLLDAKADLLLYGMSEKATLYLAEQLRAGVRWEDVPQPPNSTRACKTLDALPQKYLLLPPAEKALADKKVHAEHFALYFREGRRKKPRTIVEPYPGRYLVTAPPDNLSGSELDELFFLPFTRAPHPRYKNTPIPAYDFVRFSTITHRGCFGGCAFCAISQHQGRQIISRSEESILKELQTIICRDKDFKGIIFDLGGPTANMYGMRCQSAGECLRGSCLYPAICPHLKTSHARQKALLSRARQLPGIKKVLLNSGIRYDLALLDLDYMEMLFTHHVGGQLSLAPEHICGEVLRVMGKPPYELYVKFLNKFLAFNKKHGIKQHIVPYFISAHPGSTLEHALKLALYLNEHHLKLEQVQNFTPTPMTAATAMYYTGLDPFTKKPVHIPRGEERAFQKALLQPHLPKNYRQVAKALKILERTDLLKKLTRPDSRDVFRDGRDR